MKSQRACSMVVMAALLAFAAIILASGSANLSTAKAGAVRGPSPVKATLNRDAYANSQYEFCHDEEGRNPCQQTD